MTEPLQLQLAIRRYCAVCAAMTIPITIAPLGPTDEYVTYPRVCSVCGTGYSRETDTPPV